ncbi:hypothetical protein tpqmel_0887, partial [Candidatus Gastranaerophilus sp. (ex Termes propinquus)]
MAKGLGLSPGEEYRLVSVVGKAQLASLLQAYDSQDFAAGDNLEGVKNHTYRVNLHNHTQVSDGALSALELLEQARRYADKV